MGGAINYINNDLLTYIVCRAWCMMSWLHALYKKHKTNLSIKLADTIKNCLKITDVLRMKYYLRFEDICVMLI